MTPIKTHPIPALKDNYIWAITNPQHHRALIVDPGDAEPVLAWLAHHNLKLDGILITHHHWDHVNGVADLVRQYPVPVFGNKISQYPHLTHRIEEGDRVSPGEFFPTYQVMAIPGHTLDHLAYYDHQNLFCGDTLFGSGCGRLFEGTALQMYASLQKIARLPEQTRIYCAHEYTLDNLCFARLVEPDNQNILQRMEQVTALRDKGLSSLPSSLKEEKQTNPFLRCERAMVVHQVEHHCKRPLQTPEDTFMELRKWKDSW
jgi:hydroxyacylglutathione hydrolase